MVKGCIPIYFSYKKTNSPQGNIRTGHYIPKKRSIQFPIIVNYQRILRYYFHTTSALNFETQIRANMPKIIIYDVYDRIWGQYTNYIRYRTICFSKKTPHYMGKLSILIDFDENINLAIKNLKSAEWKCLVRWIIPYGPYYIQNSLCLNYKLVYKIVYNSLDSD